MKGGERSEVRGRVLQRMLGTLRGRRDLGTPHASHNVVLATLQRQEPSGRTTPGKRRRPPGGSTGGWRRCNRKGGSRQLPS